MESGAVTVVLREFGRKPNRKNGCHERFSLVGEGEFVQDEEDGVYVFYRDACVVDEFRDGYDIRCIKRWGRRLVKPTPERGRFRELRAGGCHWAGGAWHLLATNLVVPQDSQDCQNQDEGRGGAQGRQCSPLERILKGQ